MHKNHKKTDGAAHTAPQASAADLDAALHEAVAAGHAPPASEGPSAAAEPAPQDATPEAVADADAGLQAELATTRAQLQRLGADFENLRRRTHREQDELRRYGNQRLLTDLLPVIDNLQRALAHAPAENPDPVIQGVQMVAKQWQDVLGTYGVVSFASAGSPFDPERHEAIGQQTSSTNAPGTVLSELQTGYMMHERLLRPARVIVADQASGGSEAAKD
jgi:molecular chaperone GrpE